MTATLVRSRRKLMLEIDPRQLENLLDIGGFYNPDFIESLKESNREIKKGAVKKRKSLMEIMND